MFCKHSHIGPGRVVRWRSLPGGARQGGFSGRQQERAELLAWWSSPGRLRTLTGTAGSGKTRLATHFARHDVKSSPLVLFCDLSTAQSTADVVHQLAAVLSLQLSQQDATQQLGYALRG